MITAIISVYKTYSGDDGWHLLRLITQTMLALTVSIFSVDSFDQAFSVMSLSISVLTGFGFTALFSEPLLKTKDLPLALNENDRQDIRNLDALSLNFRKRMRLFVILAIFQLVALLSISINLELPSSIKSIIGQLKLFAPQSLNGIADSETLSIFVYRAILGLVVFTFLEWLYTFYRLSETILSILHVRESYFEAHADKS